MDKTYIPRIHYEKQIRPFIGKDIIKVIVGQRRAGKSHLLFQIIDTLKKVHRLPAKQIVYLNKELHEFEHVRTAHDLLRYVASVAPRGKKTAVFIDEIQEIERFEKALRDLQAQGRYDLYCSGSNAQLFSSELATVLSGRYIEITLFPLAYPEFLLFHHVDDSAEALQRFLRYGGMPYLIHLERDETVINQYLRSVYDSVLLKDVVSRFRVRNVAFLEQLVEYVADNVGSIVSSKKISDFLKSQKTALSPNVVQNYLSYLRSGLLIHRVPRADIQGKKIFEFNEKYYFGDIGIRNAIVGFRQTDINKILENLVYAHLMISGYRIMVGQLGTREVDFVGEKNNERIYIQVSYLLGTKATQEREFRSLLDIPDHYPKYVVTMDEPAGGSVKGVEHMHIREFLSKFW